MRFCLKFITLLLLISSIRTFAQTGEKPNIILIVFDDMNDWTQPLGGHPQTVTPTLSTISDLSTNFTNAYCSGPVCAASRTSFLLGKNPSYTGVYNNEEFNDLDFRANFPPEKYIITLPEYLKDHGGYYTMCLNKIFHADQNLNDYDTITPDPCAKLLSWNEMIYAGNDGGVISTGESQDEDIATFEWAKLDDSFNSEMQDYTMTDEANAFLENYDENPADYCNKPFFLALGYHKPHLQLYIPDQYYLPYYVSDFNDAPFEIPYNYPVNAYPFNGVVLSPQPEDEYADFEELGFVGKSLASTGVHNDFIEWGNNMAADIILSDTLDTESTAEILGKSKIANATMAYLAAIQFVDAQLGRFWDELNTHPDILNNTIVIVISDHGYSLDEKKHWKKNTLWETDIRVPFMIADMRDPVHATSAVPVSLLDLFPTLCDITGNPYPLFPDSTDYLEGKSLLPLLSEPDLRYESPVLTTYRAEAGKQASCYEQYSVHNNRFHYIRYRSNNVSGEVACSDSNSVYEEELYEIGLQRNTDPNEWNNIATDTDYLPVKEYLSEWFPGGPMYNKKTFNPEIKSSSDDCLVSAGQTVTFDFDLYDSTGVMIAPPEGYAYYWTNNVTDDTTFGLSYPILITDQLINDAGDRLFIYFHMVDLASGIKKGFDLNYFYMTTGGAPSVTYNILAAFHSTTVNVTNIDISGEYNSIWWDFGDGYTFYGANPGPHTYTSYGSYTVTCNISYGNFDTCIISKSTMVETISFDYWQDDLLLLFPNPSGDILNVATKELVSEGEIFITDITGILRAYYKIDHNALLIQRFDLTGWVPGFYAFTLKTPDSTATVPFIKM